MKKRIYLDNNASTALDPSVLDVMISDLQTGLGNPSSIHAWGQEARNVVTKARRSICSYLRVKPSEFFFTSGGTESLNMAIKGILGDQQRGHIITSNVEHACVYNTVKNFEESGWDVSYLSASAWGAVTAEAVQAAIKPQTRLLVLMAVNNETGVKTDISALARLAKEARIPFIVDGVAWLGKEQFVIPEGVSAMCFSAHKFHGPKGVGGLYLKNTPSFKPFIVGGGQENNRRGGTENVNGIVGFAEAVRLLEKELPMAHMHMQSLTDLLIQGLNAELSDVVINGQGPRICNTVNISFEGVEGESLLMNLDLAGIAVSHGSACSSGALEPSRILLNMGIPMSTASTSIRFSVSRMNTKEEIETTVQIVKEIVLNLRKITNPKGVRGFRLASQE